jgi:hypothetical protein
MKGIYEKVPESGVWWVRYADGNGKVRREKAGTKSGAITLYQKRKTKSSKAKSCRKICAPKQSRSRFWLTMRSRILGTRSAATNKTNIA